MNETAKSYPKRKARGDFDLYLKGHGIDVCCGPDPLSDPACTVDQWDMKQGDAQYLSTIPNEKYDFVYSSHGLEHMYSVHTALQNWLRVLKPGGWLYFTVPDYVYYEKCQWPSLFNGDHKYSFSNVITRQQVNRPNHYNLAADLFPLLQELGAPMENWELEIDGFNYNSGLADQTMWKALCQICVVARKAS